MIDHTSMITQPVSSPFYITGGTLRGDAASYVVRRADQELYDSLRQSQFCYVLTSRQMGKSSLMIRTAARLRENGIGVVVLDLTAVGQNLTAEQWYDGLLNRIGRQLQLEEDLEKFWFEHPRLGPLQRWMSAISEVVLPRYPGNLVIFIDEIDTVRSLPFSTDEFFAGIRELYNRRTAEPELERLTFCLLGVASPSDLIRDTRMTPFNIGQRIELHDFTADEARPLAQGLGRESRTGSELLGRVLHWTGGHPYLTQRLCRAIAEDESVSDANGVDAKCKGLFLASRAQEGDDNLLFVRERMLRSEVELAGLLTLYDQVHQGKKVRDDETSQMVSVLRLSGITRVEDGRLKVRNRIYDRVFDSDWVKEHMPDAEIRRQKMAYRRGLIRSALLSAIILIVITGLAIIAFEQRNLARSQSEINRRQLYAAQMGLAAQALESRDIENLQKYISNQIPKAGLTDLRGFEWYFFWRQINREPRTLNQIGSIMSLAFSPDGNKLISISDYGIGKMWDLKTDRELFELSNTKGFYGGQNISSVAFSPDGQKLATGSKRGFSTIWDSKTGNPILELKKPDVTLTIAFSPDGKILATGGLDKSIDLWDLMTGQLLVSLKGHSDAISSLSFSSDGKMLASGGADKVGRVWDLKTKCELIILRGHEGNISTISFSPDNMKIATGSSDKTIKLWDVAKRGQLASLSGHKMSITSLSFSPDGDMLVSGSVDGDVIVWEVLTGRLLTSFRRHLGPVHTVSFSPNGKIVASGGRDSKIRLWDVDYVQEPVDLKNSSLQNNDVAALSADGQMIATADRVGSISFWSIENGKMLKQIKGHESAIYYIAFSPDGKLLATGDMHGLVKLWKLPEIKYLRSFDHKGSILSMAFFPDNKKLAVTPRSNIVNIWNLETGLKLSVLNTKHKGVIWTVIASPDGTKMITGSMDGSAKIWDAIRLNELYTYHSHTAGITRAVFSNDHKIIVTASGDRKIKIWDTTTNKEISTLSGHTDWVMSIAISPDGKRIASGSMDGTTRIWDASNGQEVTRFSEYKKPITNVLFTPSGDTLVVGFKDGSVLIYRAATETEVKQTFAGK